MSCAICLNDLNQSEERISTLSCSHEFHHDCISRWFKASMSCPCCRSVEPSDDVDIPVFISSLMVAAQHNDIARIKELLAAGVPVDEEDYEGITPLSYAIINGQTGAASALLAAGADINHRDRCDHTILINIISCGRYAMLPFILANGADIDITDPLGDSLLEIAAFVDNVRALKLLMAHGLKTTEAAVAVALSQGNDGCVKILLASDS